MKRVRCVAMPSCVALLLIIGVPCSMGQERPAVGARPDRHQHQAPTTQEDTATAHRYFTDVVLIDQDGRELRLYSDLLKGKVVVVNAIFTTCQDSCPRLTGTFAKIQDWLGDRLGKDALLISITVDPETDVPARLKQYAEQYKARPGWHFLTGTKENVDLALRKLGQFVENKESHLSVFIIGNEATGLWKKAFGLAKPEEIIQIVESVLNDKG